MSDIGVIVCLGRVLLRVSVGRILPRVKENQPSLHRGHLILLFHHCILLHMARHQRVKRNQLYLHRVHHFLPFHQCILLHMARHQRVKRNQLYLHRVHHFLPFHQRHPPSQGTSSFSHSFYGTLPPLGYSLIPPPGYSPMPPQGYSGISPTAPFYNMPPPGCSSMPPSYITPPGMHSAYLAAMERCPSPETPSSEATRSASPRLSRLNVGSRNSEASPSRSSTPSSVDGPNLPSPGKLDHLRRVRIIADGEGFILLGHRKCNLNKEYKNFIVVPSRRGVKCRVIRKAAILNEFMVCIW
ncbi:uncharacterized protein LOC132054470 [Lycium ferocissimum]|uniref:uncharacterized protein LOC132054470 n=1 Tax=Lycium ferocissimum TaxID=112874 RepID=UPI002814C656|nr:uncharacterized protein LOC132054470 [Lycium ferocissimum]XP_059302456.1 uncharacterized protein LOC132054470 [Lycium ferocissimum]